MAVTSFYSMVISHVENLIYNLTPLYSRQFCHQFIDKVLQINISFILLRLNSLYSFLNLV